MPTQPYEDLGAIPDTSADRPVYPAMPARMVPPSPFLPTAGPYVPTINASETVAHGGADPQYLAADAGNAFPQSTYRAADAGNAPVAVAHTKPVKNDAAAVRAAAKAKMDASKASKLMASADSEIAKARGMAGGAALVDTTRGGKAPSPQLTASVGDGAVPAAPTKPVEAVAKSAPRDEVSSPFARFFADMRRTISGEHLTPTSYTQPPAQPATTPPDQTGGTVTKTHGLFSHGLLG